MVPPRKANRAGRGIRRGRLSSTEMSAMAGSTVRPGYSRRSWRGGLAQERRAHVDRHVELGQARRAHRVEDDAALLGVARAQLDQRAGAQLGHQLRHPALQQRALGAGRVVLGQPGDRLEQLRPALVVEVLGRQLLLRSREADGHLGEHAGILDRARPDGGAGTGKVRHRGRT